MPTPSLSWKTSVAPHFTQVAAPHFTYHVGPGPAKVKLHLKQDSRYRTIWDVMGKIPGTSAPSEWSRAGNHRDAWVYGAVDGNLLDAFIFIDPVVGGELAILILDEGAKLRALALFQASNTSRWRDGRGDLIHSGRVSGAHLPRAAISHG